MPLIPIAVGLITGTAMGALSGVAVARFAVPAGFLTGTGVLASYLFALQAAAMPLIEARTVALTVLVAVGLYLILVLEATGLKRRTLVSVSGSSR